MKNTNDWVGIELEIFECAVAFVILHRLHYTLKGLLARWTKSKIVVGENEMIRHRNPMSNLCSKFRQTEIDVIWAWATETRTAGHRTRLLPSLHWWRIYSNSEDIGNYSNWVRSQWPSACMMWFNEQQYLTHTTHRDVGPHICMVSIQFHLCIVSIVCCCLCSAHETRNEMAKWPMALVIGSIGSVCAPAEAAHIVSATHRECNKNTYTSLS